MREYHIIKSGTKVKKFPGMALALAEDLPANTQLA